MSLEDSSGAGVMVKGFELLHFDVHRNSVDEYAKARHTVDLVPGDQIWLNIDYRHSGLGGDTGWYRNIHPEYQIRPGRYQYSFAVRPLLPEGI